MGLTTAEALLSIQESGFTKNAIIGTVDPVSSQVPAAGTTAYPFSFIDITLTS